MPTLTAMSDARLFDEFVTACTRAAYRSEGAYEYAMELMAESQARHRRLPHYTVECEGGIYSRALAKAQATQLFRDYEPPTCACGADS